MKMDKCVVTIKYGYLQRPIIKEYTSLEIDDLNKQINLQSMQYGFKEKEIKIYLDSLRFLSVKEIEKEAIKKAKEIFSGHTPKIIIFFMSDYVIYGDKYRVWICNNCNVMHDRDINASKNINIVGTSTITVETVRRTQLRKFC